MLQIETTIVKFHTRRTLTNCALVTKKTNLNVNYNASKQPIVSCRRTQLNLLKHDPIHSKFGTIPLASFGWLNHKSKGDHFTLNSLVIKEQLQADMQPLDVFFRASGHILDQMLIQNLRNEFNITQLTRIQTTGIPLIYANNHVLIAAETGSGKTLTYLLPIIQQLIKRQATTADCNFNAPKAVILTPGRELATQIAKNASQLCKDADIKVKALLGGNTKQLMLNPKFEEVDILVATLGALSKLVTTGIYRMEYVRHFVLDEADTLLDDTFNDKLLYLLRRFPFHRNNIQEENIFGTQLILTSATMPANTREILDRVIDVETLHQVVSPNLHKLMPHVCQKFLRMAKADRPANLVSLVKKNLAKKRPLIIFSNKSATSDYISIILENFGIGCLNLNGDMLMKIRRGRFEQFQCGETNVLSTTDIGSRGLDTARVCHVVNFDFPLYVSDYIHRCGRVGRLSTEHESLVTNFISSRREIGVVQRIEHAARTGGLLPDVNANIKNIINKRIVDDMKAGGLPPIQEDAF